MLKVQDKTLTLGASASVSGGSTASMVVTDLDGLTTNDGFLCKVYAGAGSFTFPVGDAYGVTQYSPSTLAFSAGLDDPSTVCVRVDQRAASQLAGDRLSHVHHALLDREQHRQRVHRHGVVHLRSGRCRGGQRPDRGPPHHKIWNGASWTTGAAADTGANILSTPVSSFSDHTVFSASPLAVDLAHFTATVAGEGVTLAWETVSELNNAGFNVYRAGSVGDRPEVGGSVGDRRARVDEANQTLIVAPAPGSSEGHSYTFTHRPRPRVRPTGTCWRTWGLDGTATRHEPVSVTVTEPNVVGLAAFGAAPVAASMPALAGLAALAMAAAALSTVAGAGWRRRRR